MASKRFLREEKFLTNLFFKLKMLNMPIIIFVFALLTLSEILAQFQPLPQLMPWRTSDPSSAFQQWQFPPCPPPPISMRVDCCFCCCPPAGQFPIPNAPQPQIPPQPPLVPQIPAGVSSQGPNIPLAADDLRQNDRNSWQAGVFSNPMFQQQQQRRGGPLPGSPTASYWSTPSLSEAAGGGGGGEQEIGFLPNFRGDKFTNPQRIQETRNLNAPFFQQIGGEPNYAGGGMDGSLSSSMGMGRDGKRRRRKRTIDGRKTILNE